MAACERCWAEYRWRQWEERDLTYSMVVAQREARLGACTPEEQCGDLHLVIKWTDGRPDQCRCGKVVAVAEAKEAGQ